MAEFRRDYQGLLQVRNCGSYAGISELEVVISIDYLFTFPSFSQRISTIHRGSRAWFLIYYPFPVFLCLLPGFPIYGWHNWTWIS